MYLSAYEVHTEVGREGPGGIAKHVYMDSTERGGTNIANNYKYATQFIMASSPTPKCTLNSFSSMISYNS